MIEHRDAKGRITRPFGPPHSARKTRDERSGRRQDAEPGHLSVRMPVNWMRALRLIAETEQRTVTDVVMAAIEPVIRPVIQGDPGLRDEVRSMPKHLGQNTRLPRLEDRLPSTVQNPVPAFERVGRWQQRNADRGKFNPTLVDRPRR